MLVLVGASSINECPAFSVNKIIKTIDGDHAALDYVNSCIRLAAKLVERDDFPQNIDTFVQVFGSTFNYWGSKAACRKYATDYDEEKFEKPASVLKFFNNRNIDIFSLFDKLLVGQCDDTFAETMVATMGKVYAGYAQDYELA